MKEDRSIAAGPIDPLGAEAPRLAPPRLDREKLGQVVLVLQGGGALGAYQAGVYQALHGAGVEPDWVIGTSIGAINAGIIAGNAPGDRLAKLSDFWRRMRHGGLAEMASGFPAYGGVCTADVLTTMTGLPGFFQPNLWTMFGELFPQTPESAAFYSTAPLAKTLSELIDTPQLRSSLTRLTVGAAHVQTGEMRYFDSRDTQLSVAHIIASGALPPAFPAVRIDGELYWDGGILSNTPVEAVFDDNPRRSALIFVVHIWNPSGPEPDTIARVLSRQKDLQYASRSLAHIARQKQLHKLRHVISELMSRLPEDRRAQAADLGAYGCVTRMHVVRLLAPALAGESHTKDIDFSAAGVETRWRAGVEDTTRVLAQQPWIGDFDPLEGFILHEAAGGVVIREG